jgi:hypothetical protein
MRTLLRELQRPQYLGDSLEAPMFVDNTAAIALANDPVSYNRTKHIEVRYYYIRQLVAYNKLRIQHLPTKDMLADVLTKPLPFPAF